MLNYWLDIVPIELSGLLQSIDILAVAGPNMVGDIRQLGLYSSTSFFRIELLLSGTEIGFRRLLFRYDTMRLCPGSLTWFVP